MINLLSLSLSLSPSLLLIVSPENLSDTKGVSYQKRQTIEETVSKYVYSETLVIQNT